ncbi:MAG: hypothetical protein GYA73_05225 [Planctomycetes bacterium]|jgi:hypothetical protein|nr:hypothetical protein [Planctomycetota bacterium]OQC22705.1 MAG: hypothetical protein BWX70_03064 [Verrucomicrobia bacterium ADurb.Bin070]HOE31647.1 hypothetical protein [Planctomycetota bacterium]
MCHKILSDARFAALLLSVDRDLADTTQAARCRFCGERLDVANYPRKPRGVPRGGDASFAVRFSLCCAKDGCRRRATPPSVRFLGPKVYLGVIVVLITALRQGIRPPSVRKLKAALGVDRRTLQRWQRWWRELFSRSRFWTTTRVQLYPLCKDGAVLPRAVVDAYALDDACFAAPGDELGEDCALLRCLRFLAPAGADLALCEHARLWPT